MKTNLIKYKFASKANYIVSCTFGSDSMALLDMIQRSDVKPVVCMVNYHRFKENEEDFVSLKQYCDEKGLRFEVCDCNELPAEKRYQEGTDWQEWARKTRYEFFEAIYDKYNAKALFVAHQQDDLLETFLLAKEGKKVNYGLSKISTHGKMIVVRPLLLYSKEDLIAYNHQNGVPFSQHLEKHSDEATKSHIWQDVISKLGEIDRDNLISEMKVYNVEHIELMKSVVHPIKESDELDIRTIMSFSKDVFTHTLVRFAHSYKKHIDLTPSLISDIRKLCLNKNDVAKLKVADGVYFIKEYDVLTIGSDIETMPYSFLLEEPGVLNTDNFDLDFSMGAEDRGIKEEDYPLTIRTALPYDTFVIHGYVEPVWMLYSDWKMPVRLRHVWPVFVNKDGKVIYVPRYRTNFSEYHSSVLKIHVKDDEK